MTEKCHKADYFFMGFLSGVLLLSLSYATYNRVEWSKNLGLFEYRCKMVSEAR